ncbi:Fic family protein [Thermoactinomyces sp. DSM 45892]|uniref:Fic family protein n=1 Tax=Thermoactinomyces sp. DSM 45892 TaxID=1882753 RepID=UPI000894A487|nr:Fic family protein [Thermoactinomyces sp. DSM 45892]SDZ31950.1 hypothetical protein SAMN05444416_1212 [Thermoactinomyces sp. DSM 45892]
MVKPAVKKIVNTVKKVTQSATKSVSQFIRGASDRVNSNIFTLGLADLSDPNEEKGVAYHVGAVAGDIFSMLVGVSATVGGGGEVIVACGTTACAASAPGAVAAAWGTGVAGGGAKNLGQDISPLINQFFSGRGSRNFQGITGDEVRGINKGFGGLKEMNGNIDSAIDNAERYSGFWDKTASITRSIVGNHSFDNGNKRTAFEVIKELQRRNGISTGASDSIMKDVIYQVSTGNLTEVSDIARGLRGF